MTLAYRCSNCGTELQTSNADAVVEEIERLRAENKLLKDRLWTISNPARAAAGMNREEEVRK